MTQEDHQRLKEETERMAQDLVPGLKLLGVREVSYQLLDALLDELAESGEKRANGYTSNARLNALVSAVNERLRDN